MHELLRKSLDRAGVDNVSQLTEDEKRDYDKYAAILDKPELSMEDVVTFCEGEKKKVEAKFGDPTLPSEVLARLTLSHSILSKLIWFIMGNKAEREAAARELVDSWHLQE